MSSSWKFSRVSDDSIEAENLTAILRVRSCLIGNSPMTSPFWCDSCRTEESHDPYPVLLIPFNFTNTNSIEDGCDELIASFLEFTLRQISDYWCPASAASDELVPIADIVAKVPCCSKIGGDSDEGDPAQKQAVSRSGTVQHFHRVSTCDVLCRSGDLSTSRQQQQALVSRAKRRLLRRSVASMKTQDIKDFAHERISGLQYENYDIVTDEHLFDVLELFSTCHSQPAKYNIIDVSTCLYPTVCYRHNASFSFHLASMKSRSRHFIDHTLGRLHRAIEALKRLRESCDESDGLGFFHRRWIQFTNALKLPEIKRLLRTGLYSPQYVERQLSEVWDNLSNSISRGFEVPY
eukprot:Gregarina_sp_Poly_1__10173@NODE_69_length_16257_cov_66_887276_g59_i0_p5_GENE_NODE_69_length_16257_cov_66_887276_g59_i0NODE_69_length_16257_cov_66_887276_g59_i0_p5_ORF_typecomplete_len349_score48_08_NODE_69_length_16257_cov_66_887276_g59_i01507016116